MNTDRPDVTAMDFILRDGGHEDHDKIWAIFSTHHGCPVCLGCMVEVLEGPGLLPTQRKPALAELLRLLTHQYTDVLRLFMHEEEVVWHLLTVFLEGLSIDDESYVALVIEAILKLAQQVGSDDLVTHVLDCIQQQVQTVVDHTCKALLPYYTILGKLLHQLPPLARKLLHDYDSLLQQITSDLCGPGETIQSAVAYIFIFVCDGECWEHVGPRLQQQLYQGTVTLLGTAETQGTLINGLGLLKKLLVTEEGCAELMSINKDGVTLLSVVKKLLLGRQDVTQIAVAQMLALLLEKQAGPQYGITILESDMAEFLFEALNTQNTVQIECVLKTLQKLSQLDQFYKRCHAVYGIEAILRVLATIQELKNPPLLKLGHALLALVLDRQPEDVPLFMSSAMVRTCLATIQAGVCHHQGDIFTVAIRAAPSVLRKRHLLLPVPFLELQALLEQVSGRVWGQLQDQKHARRPFNRKVKAATRSEGTERSLELLHTYITMLVNASRLCIQCRSEPAACESSFTAPDTDPTTTVAPLQAYIQNILQSCDETCIPLVMMHWDTIDNPAIFEHFLDVLCLLYELDLASATGIVNKLVEAGFLSAVVDMKVKFSSHKQVEKATQFMQLACTSALQINSGDRLLPSSGQLPTVVVPNMQWKFSELCDIVSESDVDVDAIQAYLLVLYLSYTKNNRILPSEDLQQVLSSTLERQTSLEQLSPLARKHYLYLLAWCCVNEGMDMRASIPNGAQSLTELLRTDKDSWYTDDIVLLQWCFSDVVMATVSGAVMLGTYLEGRTVEELEQCVLDGETREGRALGQLYGDSTFLQCIVTCLASESSTNVEKLSLVMKACIDHHCRTTDGGDQPQQDFALQDSEQVLDIIDRLVEADGVDWDGLQTSITDVLQNVFMDNFPTSDHNLSALLEILLLLTKANPRGHSIDVKVLYHVINYLGKTPDLASELERVGLVTILASVSMASTGLDNQVGAMVVKNERLMEKFEGCIRDRGYNYTVVCDILSELLVSTNLQVPRPVCIDLPRLLDNIISCPPDVQSATMLLLASLFKVKVTSPVVVISGRLTARHYHTAWIYLQQLVLKDVGTVQEAAVLCMEEIVAYLMDVDTQLGDELLSQPWNQLLLEVLMAVSLESSFTAASVRVFTLFVKYEAGMALLLSSSDVVSSLIQCICDPGRSAAATTPQDIHSIQSLAKHLLQNVGTSLSVMDRSKLEDYGNSSGKQHTPTEITS